MAVYVNADASYTLPGTLPDIEAFPAIKAHLSRYRLELESRPECNAGRYNWWCLARYGSEYVDAFSMPKIMYPVITKESSFAFDTKGSFTNDKGYIIPLNDLYLLGILNSSSAWRNIAAVCSPLRGGFFELRSTHLGKIPVPNAALRERHIIADLVQHCLDARGVGCEEGEAEIDARVARLYGLHE